MITAIPAKDLIEYEIFSSVWAPWISWGPMQDIVAAYFARKVLKKRNRYLKVLHKKQRELLRKTL